MPGPSQYTIAVAVGMSIISQKDKPCLRIWLGHARARCKVFISRARKGLGRWEGPYLALELTSQNMTGNRIIIQASHWRCLGIWQL